MATTVTASDDGDDGGNDGDDGDSGHETDGAGGDLDPKRADGERDARDGRTQVVCNQSVTYHNHHHPPLSSSFIHPRPRRPRGAATSPPLRDGLHLLVLDLVPCICLQKNASFEFAASKLQFEFRP